jgi:ABC-type phosphate/phosphonate transport system substrate-binding protein
MVVMDPLAAPLSCPCVEGYAQRDYEVLAEHLASALGRTVEVTFAESLETALQKSGRPADIVIGKQSVVHSDAKKANLDLAPVCRLTDLKGSTTQFGMIVVRRDDPARSIEDLSGYTMFFGPAEAEEKHSAALQLLSEAGISITEERQKISPACSDGACKVVDMGPKSKAAAVISSYAQPLLEGCGTIKKGDLRVLAETKPVPFVTLFAADTFDHDDLDELRAALSTVAVEPKVLEALESLVGFLPIEDSSPKKKAKS